MRIIRVELAVSEEVAADLEKITVARGREVIRLDLTPGVLKHGEKLGIVDNNNQVVGNLVVGSPGKAS
jgi:hypothetical protein